MRDDRSTSLWLVIAFVAVIATPVSVQVYRYLQPPARLGPEALLAAADSVDAFWADQFSRQFPGAWSSYRSPDLRFDDLATNPRAAQDGFAGYYRPDAESIHVDLNRERSDGFLLMVVAHEYGHHVQKLAGLNQMLNQRRLLASGVEAARLGVRYELQAECLAGVWARFAAAEGAVIDERDVLSWRRLEFFGGDIPTHGTARQRLNWFNAGYARGLAEDCDTFAPAWETL